MPPRSPLWTFALLLAACDDTHATTVAPASSAFEPAPLEPAPLEPARAEPVADRRAAPVDEPPLVAPPPLAPETLEWLDAGSVTDDAFARRVLFTWTTHKTAEQLRADGVFFNDAQLPEGPTAYVSRLEHTAARKGAVGKMGKLLLGHPSLAQRRYAWPNPWATRLGAVRPYGDVLVAVQLRAESLIGRYDPSRSQPWHFVDLDGRAVPLARALARADRIAAIYHVAHDADPQFREYVLCNESAIETWSLATAPISKRIGDDAEQLRRLAASGAPPTGYDDALAFSVEHYQPTPDNLRAIATALDATTQVGTPFTVTPSRRFKHSAKPGLVKVRAVPKPFVMVV